MQLCDKLREEKPCIYRAELIGPPMEDQPDCLVWNLEEREDLRRYLHQQPRHDCVGDSNLVNVAPL